MSTNYLNLSANYHEQLIKAIFNQIQSGPKEFENSLNDYWISLKLHKN